ncbi:HTTM domain-containing protein [Streptomyces sp. URMC 123]|uniref:HTTM domain-containing protein n=1 Tax=Streptomyces sp. URMC 123 TaxID=3423403 RepID=UPI003F1B8C33
MTNQPSPGRPSIPPAAAGAATEPDATHSTGQLSTEQRATAQHPTEQRPAAPAPGTPWRRLPATWAGAVSRGLAQVLARPLGPHQTAVVRIGFAFTWLCFLLREWPYRHELYGPGGPWSWDMARQFIGTNDAFTLLMWSHGRGWFEAVYALALVSSALLMVGWRTRTMSVLFMVGVLSLQNRSILMGDGGDNVIHLVSLYLVLTRCGAVWSLDARRRARAAATTPGARAYEGPGEPGRDLTGLVLWAVLGLALATVTLLGQLSTGWALVFWGLWAAHALWWAAVRHARDRGGPTEAVTVLDTLANLAHNGALLVIMVEVCLIYATAGWYKVQGSRWQDGTALFYPMNLDYFSPWPALSDALGSSGLMVMVITYGTVIVQVAFPFTLFNRRVKNVLLVVMMVEHAAIAVVLGLPFFSLAMIAADAVFLPTGFLRGLGARVGRGTRRLFPHRAPAVLPGPRSGDTGADAGTDTGAGTNGDPSTGTGANPDANPDPNADGDTDTRTRPDNGGAEASGATVPGTVGFRP